MKTRGQMKRGRENYFISPSAPPPPPVQTTPPRRAAVSGSSPLVDHGREPHDDGGLDAGGAQEVGAGQVGHVVGDLSTAAVA